MRHFIFFIISLMTVKNVSAGGEPDDLRIISVEETSILLDGGSIIINGEVNTGEKIKAYIDMSITSQSFNKMPIISMNDEPLEVGGEVEKKLIKILHEWVVENTGSKSIERQKEIYFKNRDENLYKPIVVISFIEATCYTRKLDNEDYLDFCNSYMPSILD